MPRPSRNKEPIDPRAKAIALLARREHSARELKRKLEARGISRDDAERAVRGLAQDGWQSDARYAELLVRSRVASGYGPVRIEAELKLAGVDADAARRSLDQPGVDWRALCDKVRSRRFHGFPQSSTERAKQYRFLMARGFDSSQISAALKGEAIE